MRPHYVRVTAVTVRRSSMTVLSESDCARRSLTSIIIFRDSLINSKCCLVPLMLLSRSPLDFSSSGQGSRHAFLMQNPLSCRIHWVSTRDRTLSHSTLGNLDSRGPLSHLAYTEGTLDPLPGGILWSVSTHWAHPPLSHYSALTGIGTQGPRLAPPHPQSRGTGLSPLYCIAAEDRMSPQKV